MVAPLRLPLPVVISTSQTLLSKPTAQLVVAVALTYPLPTVPLLQARTSVQTATPKGAKY